MNRIALVTGSSRGIGKAIALTLGTQGYKVIIHYNQNKNEAEKSLAMLGKKALCLVQADLTKVAEVERMFEDIKSKTNKLDLLVNNAGFDHGKLIEDYTFAEMEYVLNVILTSKFYTTKLALPLLKKSEYPTIINIASRMGREKTIPTIGAYGPAQAGVIKFTQCCALEFSKYKIRVNCIAPSLTRTGLTESILTEDDFEAAAKKNPRGRVGRPEDIADMVAFLASDKADYVTGETIGVNGGSTLG